MLLLPDATTKSLTMTRYLLETAMILILTPLVILFFAFQELLEATDVTLLLIRNALTIRSLVKEGLLEREETLMSLLIKINQFTRVGAILITKRSGML